VKYCALLRRGINLGAMWFVAFGAELGHTTMEDHGLL